MRPAAPARPPLAVIRADVGDGLEAIRARLAAGEGTCALVRCADGRVLVVADLATLGPVLGRAQLDDQRSHAVEADGT